MDPADSLASLSSGILEALRSHHLVLTAPTGAGKSTRVPCWLLESGLRVLVIEPRRVACRALAQRAAELRGSSLGGEVGYQVRRESRRSPETRLLYVTTGIALRWLSSTQPSPWDVVVLDEFHERSLDLDLLLALLLRRDQRLLVCSATMEHRRLAAHMDAQLLEAQGRNFPIELVHLPGELPYPSARGLSERVRAAVQEAGTRRGDVLVFLPGKREIREAEQLLRVEEGFRVMTLHGGLSLQEQARVFLPSDRPRLILSTNVAETSLTLPDVGVVIDSGLVRQTRTYQGRSVLVLSSIAADSAQQRAGRAGRTGPGVCYRLWHEAWQLPPTSPPAVLRDSLVPMVLAASAAGSPLSTLPCLDPPPEQALREATQTLQSLEAIDDEGAITAAGQELSRFPLDAALGRLLITGQQRGVGLLAAALCAALSLDRSLLRSGESPQLEPSSESRRCDAWALIQAVLGRESLPADPQLLREARARLRELQSLVPELSTWAPQDRRSLALSILSAWPRSAHIKRQRRRHCAWANGGTELSLGRGSRVPEEKTEALLMLESRAFQEQVGHRKPELVITQAMPLPLAWLVEAGLGRSRLAGHQRSKGRWVTQLERVYAGRVIACEEQPLQGALAPEGFAQLLLEGRILKPHGLLLRQRFADYELAAQLGEVQPLPPLSDWLLEHLRELGLEEEEDLQLLEPEDLAPPALPPLLIERLRRDFPDSLSTGDARYDLVYRIAQRELLMRQVTGTRKQPPPESIWPRLRGWRLLWEYKNRVRCLRDPSRRQRT